MPSLAAFVGGKGREEGEGRGGEGRGGERGIKLLQQLHIGYTCRSY